MEIGAIGMGDDSSSVSDPASELPPAVRSRAGRAAAGRGRWVAAVLHDGHAAGELAEDPPGKLPEVVDWVVVRIRLQAPISMDGECATYTACSEKGREKPDVPGGMA